METRGFPTTLAWRRWLQKEHARSEGLLLQIYKKDSGIAAVTYDEALDQALCFGWIDGVRLPHDELAYLVRFTPRRKRSLWSKRNTEHVARLVASGEMTPAGMREVEAAKADGRWDAAYDSPANMKVPPEFLKALARNARARAFFTTISRTNYFSIAYRLHNAKRAETRLARIEMIVAMLARGETFHPQKAKAKAKSKSTARSKPKAARP